MSNKKSDMKKLFAELQTRCEEDALYGDEYNLELYKNFETKGVACLIAKSDGSPVFSTDSDPESLVDQLDYTMFTQNESEFSLKPNKNYKIFTQKYPELDADYLILIGFLSDGNVVYLRSSVDLIENTASSSKLFCFLSYIFAIVLAVLISQILVARFTRPLFDIIEITKRISNFDFDAKYKPQPIYNELDDLGEHITEMSTTLKRAINQLRSANDRLQKDLEIREETENMRKEFVSNVSHELKTPIALIQGYAEGLQEGIMDDENSRQIYLDVILDEANKMNRLVREMLILNQLEAGQMNMDLADFNVTEMIDSVVENNKLYFTAQNISYQFINKEDCIVKADEFLVEQVVTNFISNAIHYVMNENVITVRYEFAKKGKVRIIVFNSGNNIAKKDIKHIWEKFYKADKARSREYGGSGIGLSVVKATMDLLHEKFGVENLSNGVEFWFELTLAKDTKNKQNS
ncbi:MAG: HAMP domain-containing histidine kinase [Pseudobutyrivibrio sp.]|nr:HAMP domain-containing histidine kinase [Pseudobutyrivibrio sp.]